MTVQAGSARRQAAGLTRLGAALVVVLAVLLALAGGAQAQDRALYWQRYDVDIAILKSGDIRVTETQELVFTSGTFRFGQREIPLQRLDNLGDFTVAEEGGPEYVLSDSGEPYTYSVRRENGSDFVRYNFPPSSDMRRTIVIGYTVEGALRYYPEKGVDQLYWKAIPAGNPFPVRTSIITLHLPDRATFTNYGIYGAEATSDFQPGQTDAVITVQGPIRAGQEVEVVAEWQHGVVAGAPAAWQQTLDQQAEVRARTKLGRHSGGRCSRWASWRWPDSWRLVGRCCSTCGGTAKGAMRRWAWSPITCRSRHQICPPGWSGR